LENCSEALGIETTIWLSVREMAMLPDRLPVRPLTFTRSWKYVS
jgi:hypothetical protein